MSARTYLLAELLAALNNMPRSTFYDLKAAGQLPFVEEIRPRLGRRPRYRADLVDRYLAGEWGHRAYLTAHKRKVTA